MRHSARFRPDAVGCLNLKQARYSVVVTECKPVYREEKPPLKSELAASAPNSEERSGLHDMAASLAIPPRYKLLSEIAAGGMGVVYLAKHQVTGQKLALKILHNAAASDLVNLKRFKIEAASAGSLTDPHIVKIIDFGVTEKSIPFLVMEYLEGETLSERLKRVGNLDSASFFDVFTQICEGLANAHKNKVIHRDLKPSNIMLSKTDSGADFVRILDFGLARVVDEEGQSKTLTKTGEVVGSPPYMSPEQGLGHKCDERSDIYSFGCMMYEALTGKLPFMGENAVDTIFKHINDQPLSLSAQCPGQPFSSVLQSVLSRCMEKDPDRRYQSVVQLLTDLKAASTFHEGKKWQSAYRPPSKYRKFVIPAMILSLVAAPLIYFAVGWSIERSQQPDYMLRIYDAEAAYDEKHYEKALKDGTAAVALVKGKPVDNKSLCRLYYDMARINRGLGERDKSARWYHEASTVAEDPVQQATYIAWAGDMYNVSGNHEAAANEYRQSIKLKNANPNLKFNQPAAFDYINLSDHLNSLGKYHEASLVLQSALKDGKATDGHTRAVLLFRLGSVEQHAGNKEGALRTLREARSLALKNGDDSLVTSIAEHIDALSK